MGEFNPITTQEDFDAAIKGRLDRQTSKHQAEISSLTEQHKAELEKYADYDDLKKAVENHAKSAEELKSLKEAEKSYKAQIAEKDAKIKEYEVKDLRARIASELNMPTSAVDFIKGDTEEAVRESAEALKKMMGTRSGYPLASATPGASSGISAALHSLARNI